MRIRRHVEPPAPAAPSLEGGRNARQQVRAATIVQANEYRNGFQLVFSDGWTKPRAYGRQDVGRYIGRPREMPAATLEHHTRHGQPVETRGHPNRCQKPTPTYTASRLVVNPRSSDKEKTREAIRRERAMFRQITARAYSSTANLGHGMDFLGLALDAASDEVTAERGHDGIAIDAAGEYADGLPTEPERNTAGLAAVALCEAHGLRPALRLTVHKGIRPGSGLGSSAASAAAAVVAVDRLLGLGSTRMQLIAAAAAGEQAASGVAHADNVAPSIVGGFVIVAPEAPWQVVSVPTAGQPRFVAVLPEVVVKTREARAALPETVTMHEYSRGAAQAAMAVTAWRAGDMRAFGAAIEGSLVDAVRSRFIPAFAEVAAAARSAGATGVAVSGAGPTVLAVVPEDSDSGEIATAMSAAFAAAGVACTAFEAGVAPGAQVIGRSG